MPTFREALHFWLKLGLVSFGGPSGQIALMHGELVEKRKWIDEERFLHALNYCMLLPGPEAQQLATYIGWLLHGTRGGLAAGILFVLPAALLLLILSWVYVVFGEIDWIAAFFYGLKPAVIAIVAVAVLRLGHRALKTSTLWSLAGLSFVAIFFFKLPFPLIILGAALIGWIGGKRFPTQFGASLHDTSLPDNNAPLAANLSRFSGGWRRTLHTVSIGTLIWLAPVFLLALWLGQTHSIVRESLFFSKTALITFGGAYAVLPYVAQHAVEQFHWLTPPQMLDGLALAETTPGPLIMVLQFVGFVGAWQNPGTLSPLTAALLGAGITTWATFAPSFVFIFAGAPYIEKLRGVTALTTALSAITAVVVGVILNLAVWFAWHTIFTDPTITPATAHDSACCIVLFPFPVDTFALLLSIIGFILLRKTKLEVFYLVPIFGSIGVLYSLL